LKGRILLGLVGIVLFIGLLMFAVQRFCVVMFCPEARLLAIHTMVDWGSSCRVDDSRGNLAEQAITITCTWGP